MTGRIAWLHRALTRSVFATIVGCAIGVVLVLVWGPIIWRPAPIVLMNEHEADGIIARNGQIDLVGVRDGESTCPGATQRYLWRPVAGLAGEPGAGIQIVPLPMTVLPAFLPNGPTEISIPVPSTVTPGKWFYRAVSMESCSLLPSWLGGSKVHRTADIPIEMLSEGSLHVP